jgi:hypothetical protein
MRGLAMISVTLAVVGVAAALVGYGMTRDPACYDPPCGGAKDTLIIYGTVAAIIFGALGLLVALALMVQSFLRRTDGRVEVAAPT